MESMMEKKIDQLMERPGVLGVCVSDSNGLSLSTRGSLKKDMAHLGPQLVALCSQLEPSSSATPEVVFLSDHCKITFCKHEDCILALHQSN